MRVLFTFIGLTLVVVWLVLFRPAYLGGSTGYISVVGASMEPTFFDGDLAIVREQQDYEKGDIIAFKTEHGIVIHRIIGGDGDRGYRVQGDNRVTPDLWQPRSDQVVGGLWFIVPHVGSGLREAKAPLPFGLILGVLGMAAVAGNKNARRRRDGRWKNMGKQNRTSSGISAPAWLIGAFSLFCVMAAASAFVASQAFRSPTERTQTFEQLRFDETVIFNYTASVAPSNLYPNGVVEPVHSDAEEGASTTIYSVAPPQLELGLSYQLIPRNAPPALDFYGTISAVAEISAGDNGWTKVIDVLPATPFEGLAVDARLPMDLSSVYSLIETIETETGFSALSYQVAIKPTIHVTGNLGAHAIDNTFSPPFVMQLGASRVTLDPALEHAETRIREETIAVAERMTVLGLGMTVRQARALSAILASLGLAGALGLAAVLFLGFGRGEAARIRARYGSMVIAVADANLPMDETLQIRLASIHDLVRLANRDSRMVFHQSKPDGSDVYFIQDGQLTYLYVSGGQPAGGSTQVQEA